MKLGISLPIRLHSILFGLLLTPLLLPAQSTNPLSIYHATELRFPTQAGKVYQFQSASNVTGPYVNMGSAFFGSGDTNLTFVRAAQPGQRFFYLADGDPANALDFTYARSLGMREGIRVENVKTEGARWWYHFRFIQSLQVQERGQLPTVTVPWATNRPMAMDGSSADWETNGIPVLQSDPADDQEGTKRPGTDASAFYVARDATNLYFAFRLHNAIPPSDGTIFCAELQLFQALNTAPGDTFFSAFYDTWNGNWLVSIQHRETGVNEHELDSSFVGVGLRFIEFTVPIELIEFDGYGSYPKIGIENRFLRAYVHYYPPDGGPSDPRASYDSVADGNMCKLIIGFY